MSSPDERRWALRWLGAPVERLSSEQCRELIEAAALAWLVANTVFGHATPVFAPIAAIVSLGATRGQRARRAKKAA